MALLRAGTAAARRPRSASLIAEGKAEISGYGFHWGAAGGVDKDHVVFCGSISGWRQDILHFVSMRGFDRVEGGTAALSAGVVRELVGVHQKELDVGGVVAEIIVSGARNEGLKRPVNTRNRGVRRNLHCEMRGCLYGECLVQEIDRLDIGRDRIERVR